MIRPPRLELAPEPEDAELPKFKGRRTWMVAKFHAPMPFQVLQPSVRPRRA